MSKKISMLDEDRNGFLFDFLEHASSTSKEGFNCRISFLDLTIINRAMHLLSLEYPNDENGRCVMQVIANMINSMNKQAEDQVWDGQKLACRFRLRLTDDGLVVKEDAP